MDDIPYLAQQVYEHFPHDQEYCCVFRSANGMYEAVVDASTQATKTSDEMKAYLERNSGVKFQGIGMEVKRGKSYYVIGFSLERAGE